MACQRHQSDAFRQGAEAVRRHWKEAEREGEPLLTLRVPILLAGVHRPAVDMAMIRGRHLVQGSMAQVVEELRGFRALDCAHVALEVSRTPRIRQSYRPSTSWLER